MGQPPTFMMKLAAASLGASWLLMTGAASAQSGELGAQSRASVRISVSVAPAFRMNRQVDEDPASAGAMLRPIDPSLRYALVTVPPAVKPGYAREGRTLLLIVPD